MSKVKDMTGNSYNIYEKSLISKRHKLLLLINKKKKIQFLKWAKNIHEQFVEEILYRRNKYMRRCLKSPKIHIYPHIYIIATKYHFYH